MARAGPFGEGPPLDGGQPPGGADAHSRLVGLAKVALPMAGLALLSGLFLLAGGDERSQAPLAPAAQGAAREQRLGAPVHAGVTEDGNAIEVSADLARPDPRDPRLMEAQRIRAHVETPRGVEIELHAPQGRIDTAAGVAVLSGGIRLVGSDGETGPIEAETAGVRFDLRTGRAESEGAVGARAPMGALDAGALVVEGDRIAFGGGVRLVLAPRDASVAGRGPGAPPERGPSAQPSANQPSAKPAPR